MSMQRPSQKPRKSDISRRSAIKGMATGLAAGALAFQGVDSRAFAATSLPKESDEWRNLLGNRFQVCGPVYETDSVAVEVQLEQVRETDWKPKDPNRPALLRRSSISLLFSSDEEIPSATYAIGHERLGKSQLFLHAVLRNDLGGKRLYEIILN